jgi:photosystem II stability/assembly factor-like uncharacterized protein
VTRWRRLLQIAAVLGVQVLAAALLVSTLTGAHRGEVATGPSQEVAPPPAVPESTTSTLGTLVLPSTTSTRPATTTSAPTTTSGPTTTTATTPKPPATAPAATTTTAPTPACSPPPAGQLTSVQAIGPRSAWTSGHSDDGHRPAVQLTGDGGRTWSTTCLPVQGQGSVAGVGQRGGRTWVVGSSSGTAFAARTADGGASWALGALPDGLTALEDADFVDEDRGWAIGSGPGGDRQGGAVVVTTDGGASWRRQALPVDADLSAIDFADSLRGVIVGLGPAGPVIMTTANGGAGWEVATLPEGMGPASAIRDVVLLGQQGFAVGDAGILATFDGGTTWEVRQAVSEDCCLAGVFFLDPDHGWAVGGGANGRVYRTSNGGWTWEHQATVSGTPFQAVSFGDGLHGFAVARQRPCLFATEDGGSTWTGWRLDGGGAC